MEIDNKEAGNLGSPIVPQFNPSLTIDEVLLRMGKPRYHTVYSTEEVAPVLNDYETKAPKIYYTFGESSSKVLVRDDEEFLEPLPLQYQ